MTEPGPRTAVAVLVFELVALALLMWLAASIGGCAMQPIAETDYLDRGISACNIVPSDGVHPCVIELETSDERIIGRLRSLTGCMVRTRQIVRQPDTGIF